MELEIKHGRPDDAESRAPREARVYELLDRLGIEYDRIDHEPLATMEACAGVDRTFGTEMCKNLLLCNRQKTKFYLLLTPGNKPFRTKELSAELAIARLSFADGEKMVELLDIHPGSLSVMGLMNDRTGAVTLLIDRDVADGEYIACHPCVNTSSMKIRTCDILEKFLPAVAHEPTFVTLTGSDE